MKEPPNEYGWLTARTEAEIEALGVILSSDEVQQWGKWKPFAPDVHGQKFAKGLNPVRRRINPNSDQPPGSEPFEMVPEAEFKKYGFNIFGCEYTLDGKTWSNKILPMGGSANILAVRRRKRVVGKTITGDTAYLIKTSPATDPIPEQLEQLDDAANALYDEDSFGCVGLFSRCSEQAQTACRRHLAVVKEWQAKFQAERKAHQELILCMPPEQRWLHISPGNLPKAGQGFACAWEVNGKKYATAHPNGTPDPASMLLKNATGYIGWFPLPPLPEQQSEAERCIDDIYDVCELRPVATKQELAVLAKSILDWSRKETKE